MKRAASKYISGIERRNKKTPPSCQNMPNQWTKSNMDKELPI